jgi:hypothetical protein
VRSSYYSKKQAKQRIIEITSEKHENGKAYPITEQDARKILEQQNPDDIKGIKAVRFEEAKNVHQKGAWAQYKRGKREIAIFSQPQEEITPQVHMMMKEEVVPHEIGHHVALTRRNITDPDLEVAEARADAYAAGLDVEDRDVQNFVKERPQARSYNYTPTFVAGDLPLIAADGVGTAGAAAVPLIPVLVTAGVLFLGAREVKKQVDKNKKK